MKIPASNERVREEGVSEGISANIFVSYFTMIFPNQFSRFRLLGLDEFSDVNVKEHNSGNNLDLMK